VSALAPVFVDTQVAADLMSNSADVKVIDCTVLDDGDPVLAFHQQHIQGAQYIDLRYFRNQSSPYPYMLTSPQQFTDQMKLLNIKTSTRVLLYDQSYGYPATRIYWMLRTFGHENVSVINGGLKKWMSENRTVVSTPGYGTDDDYAYVFQPQLYRSFEQIIELEKLIPANLTTEQIVDARSPAMYNAGHIIGAKNLLYKLTMNADGTIKTPQEILDIAAANGVSFSDPITAHCYAGMSASWLFAALQHAGHNQTALYDGSWAEYSDRKNKSVESLAQLASSFFLY
jgi:thiosulfate/3-mercaptopyruvate sulfurtransferase